MTGTPEPARNACTQVVRQLAFPFHMRLERGFALIHIHFELKLQMQAKEASTGGREKQPRRTHMIVDHKIVPDGKKYMFG
jgi:hypothetical protein